MNAVFLEKVRSPERRGLARDRLVRRLLDRDGPGLALVLAPPGSGKTTLLTHVAAIAPSPLAWYRVSPEDDDETTLVRHLGAALNGVLGGRAISAVTAATCVDQLVTELEYMHGEPVAFVVDDLHEIAGSQAERALERFLQLRPRSVRVLMGSRRPPLMNTSRLLVSGALRELSGDDLRFRTWEVEELFRAVYGQPLSPESAAALTRRTGGWAAGLQLFHLATAGMTRVEREHAVMDLSGRSRLIRSYLTRNVLDGLPEERRRFLLRSCTLGLLTGELCDALLGTTGSASILADLERQQFFTTSNDGISFRYHQVLQTYLEVVLVDEVGTAAARGLWSRSGTLLEGAGFTADALRAHARAEDWGAVARLVQHSALAVPADDEHLWGVIGRSAIPVDDPSLILAKARRLMRKGLVADAVAEFRLAETLLDDPDFRGRCADERHLASVWLPRAPEPLRAEPVSGDRTVRLARQLRSATTTVDPAIGGAGGLTRGVCLLLAGEYADAERTLRAALGAPVLAAWENLTIRLAAVVAAVAGGRDEDNAGHLEEITLSADLEGHQWLARLARGLQAALLLAKQPTPWRSAAGDELVADAGLDDDMWMSFLLAFAVGAAHAVIGEDEQALSQLRRAEHAADELGAPVLQVWASAVAAWAVRGRPGPHAERDAERLRHRAEALGASGAARLLDDAAPAPPGRAGGPARRSGQAPIEAHAVSVNCLGAYRLVVDGVDAPWVELRPRARALLFLLSMNHGHDVHREHLIDALWPEATLASGRRNLQVAASSIRQCLIAAGLSADGLQRHADAYSLHLPRTGFDIALFEEGVHCATRLEAAGDAVAALRSRLSALDLYTGDLLPEVGPADWVVAERGRLRTVAACAAADAAHAALDLGEVATGLRAAQRSLQLDPYRDTTWLVLTGLHERMGDRTAAAVARREHARICGELGLPVPRASRVQSAPVTRLAGP